MFPSVSIIIFRILNFIALMTVSAYFFKRYAYPTIRDNQSRKKMALLELEQEKELLATQQEAIDAHSRKQEATRTALLERLKIWRDAFDHEKQVRLHGRNQMRERLREQLVISEHHAQQKRIEQKLIPDAIARAREHLSMRFADPKQAERYLTDLKVFMEKQ